MSRPTPETDAAIIEADGAWTFALKNKMQSLERERDEARERERVAIASWDEERQRALREGERVVEARNLARELLDELVWKGKLVGLTRLQQTLITKAKEVLP